MAFPTTLPDEPRTSRQRLELDGEARSEVSGGGGEGGKGGRTGRRRGAGDGTGEEEEEAGV
eukprot:339316-Rhodomonas_salina.5